MASYPDREWLHERYNVDGLSQREMADLAGVRPQTVGYHMKKKDVSVGREPTIGGVPAGEVERLYHEEEMSTVEIANMLDTSYQCIIGGMKRHDIKRRSNSEARRLQSRSVDGGLSQGAIEALEGEMLGDGCMPMNPNSVNARFEYGVSSESHRDWVADRLKSFGLSVNREHRVRDGFDKYRLATKSYTDLTEVRKRWYTGDPGTGASTVNEGKAVPEDIAVTPTVLLHWHLGDGTWCERNHQIKLAAQGFTDDGRQILVKALSDVGIEATSWADGNVGVRAKSRDRYFDFMADPPAGVKGGRFR